PRRRLSARRDGAAGAAGPEDRGGRDGAGAHRRGARDRRDQPVTDEIGQGRLQRMPGGLTLRAMVPNAITAAALCVGLTGIRFAIAGEFEKLVLAITLAGMLDGIDERIARLL